MRTRKHVLERTPDGKPTEADFELIESDVSAPSDRDVLVDVRYISLDPGQRSRLGTGADYAGALNVAVGETVTGYAVGDVLESQHPEFSAGDTVTGELEWAERCVVSGDDLEHVDVPEGIADSAILHVLGGTGRTAYFGLLDIGRPRPGDTVVISAAAGAVGSVAGQIATMAGCRVVGITGSERKTEFITNDLGFDVAINYKDESVPEALDEQVPEGVDVYFDNVGGEIYDAVRERLNQRGRIAVCGKISLYNDPDPPPAPRYMHQRSRVREEGFLVHDFANRFDEADARLAKWLKEGKLVTRENVTEGIERLPAAFIGLFEGENIGKQLVKLD
ncbi:MAG: NADP-dependent oxidoreductase [Salinirussus sp.]